MKSRRLLSVLLSVSLLLGLLSGTMAFSASAKIAGLADGTVSYRSPAILANVGDTIDLTKYGVEFAEGVVTKDGLTWYKEGISSAIVPFDNPALFANVGDTVNFADYKVELSKGNTVSADKLTWKQELVQKIIPANNLIMQVEKGAKVDLRTFAVEGMGATLTWKLDGKVVTAITAKAGDVLTVTDGVTTKDVIVATKDGDEYVVYENDFSDAADVTRVTRTPYGASESQIAYSVSDGVFHTKRQSGYSTGQENAALTFPSYLWGLSNYTVEFKSSFVNWIKNGTSSTSQAGTVKMGMFINGDTTTVRPQHLIMFSRANKIYTYTRTDATKYVDSLTLEENASKLSNFDKGTWVAFKVKVDGMATTMYYDYDTESDPKGYSGTYKKVYEYDFSAVESQTHTATTGAIGLSFYHGDFDVDDVKITVPAIEYATKDATATFAGYTPAAKGVTAFTVSDGTTSRVVYLVTKNVEDTEYVLYENTFDVDGDLGGIERAGIGGDETKFGFTVANGKFSAVRAGNYVSSVENTSLILPEYLWNFTNFSLSFKAQFTDWAKKDNATSQKAIAYVGAFVHGDTTVYRPQHLVTFSPASNLQAMTRINESKYATSETLVTKYDSTIPNLSKNQWIGYKMDVEGSKVSASTDFDTETTAPTGTFIKRVDHDFAEVEGQTLTATTGAIGLAFFRADVDVDDIKVTIPATEPVVELQQVTSFTPAVAGVTPITVKCGEVEKTIYVVAKNAVETEYVLYENTFDSAEDLADLTVLKGAVNMSVADGKLVLDGQTKLDDNGGDGGAYVRLPEWLGAFGDYEIEANVVRDTYDSSKEGFGFFARSANADNVDSAYFVRTRFTNTVSDAIVYAERMPGLAKPRTYTWGIRSNTSMHKLADGKTNTVKMGVAGDTVNMQIIDMDDDGRADDNYVLYATEQKTLRTGHLGMFVSKVVMYVDTVRVTLPALPDAPTAATFTPNADLTAGTIAGKLDVTLPGTGIEPSDVVYYWGNGECKLPGYGAFEKMLVVNNATSLSATIPTGTVIPAGATELRVYAMNLAGESTDCIAVPLNGLTAKTDEKLFSFIVASDWHIAAAFNEATGDPTFSTANNDAHFAQMFDRFKTADASATQIFFGGDLVDGQKGAQAEYARFEELWNTYAQGYTFDGVIGNHEYWFNADEEAAGNTTHAYTVNNFAAATGVPITPEKPYYSKKVNGYDFFFLNTTERDDTGRQSHNDSTLGDAQLTWLDEGLAAATANGKPAFVFHHQKFNQITDADALKAVLKKYPTAVFVTSHSHEDMNRKNIFSLADETMCNQLNTSAVTFVLPTHYNSNKEQARHMSQAYIAEMYSDRVVFRGMDLMTGAWIPNAQFAFTYEAVEEQAPNTVVVDEETKTLTVKADDGYQLKAGSLMVKDADGNYFAPVRVGFRDGGNGEKYEIPEDAKAPYTVEYEFIQPGEANGYNVGFLGNSVNEDRGGLRFVHHFEIDKDGYVLYDGQKVKVAEYGLLVASASILPNAKDLDIETAEESMHVHRIRWGCDGGSAKFYDRCDDFAQISVQIVGIPAGAARDLDFHTRAYLILEGGKTVYMDAVTCNYNAAK